MAARLFTLEKAKPVKAKINYELYVFCIQALVSLMMICFCFSKLSDKALTSEDKLLYGSWLTGTISAWTISPGGRKDQNSNNNTYIDSDRTNVETNKATIVTEEKRDR